MRALRCSMVGVDASGLGTQFAARAESRWSGRAQSMQYSSKPQREEIVTALRLIMERKGVRLNAADKDLRRDVLMLRRTVTAAGNTTVNAPRTVRGHSDRAWALAMAVTVSGDHKVGGKPLASVASVSTPARAKPSIWGSGPRMGKTGIR